MLKGGQYHNLICLEGAQATAVAELALNARDEGSGLVTELISWRAEQMKVRMLRERRQWTETKARATNPFR